MNAKRGRPKQWTNASPEQRAECGNRCQCRGECGKGHQTRCEAQHGQPRAGFAGWPVILTLVVVAGELKCVCQQCHLGIDDRESGSGSTTPGGRLL